MILQRVELCFNHMHTVMKSINRIFGSFIIVCLALVSCEKEKHPQSVDPEQPAVVVRTISVSFDTKSTRTELVGVKPYFKDGDLIKMAQVDGEAEPQVCTVKVVDKKASVETTLEGKLKAVYPYGCAVVSNNKITGVSVPASQNGTFEEAHICMAEQAREGDESLEFHNQTPILRFYVDKSIQVQSITITPSSGSAITVSPSSGDYFTTSVLDEPDKRICYAAVPSGLNTKDFKFTSTTGTQGTVEQTLKATTSLVDGTMYNIFIPYYIEVGDQKWGYCNVGAFLPEEFGKYFLWNEIDGPSLKTNWQEIVPDENNVYLNAFNEESFNPELGLGDAASYHWGEDWRVPTKEAMETIIASEDSGKQFEPYYGIYGWKVGNDLFFPAAGHNDFDDSNSFVWELGPNLDGWYRSSSSKGKTSISYYMLVFNNYPNTINLQISNDYGYDLDMRCSIRPIYVGGDAPDTNITGDSLDPYGKDTETF